MFPRFRLTLNEVALLYVPENTHLRIKDACIVQLIVRSIGMTSGRSPSIDDRATFFCYADEISSVVENVILGNLMCANIPETLVLEGEKYILRASRKDWSKGKNYLFKWGDQLVAAAAEKWIFEMVPVFESSVTLTTLH